MLTTHSPEDTWVEPSTEKKVRVQLDFERKDMRTINRLVDDLGLTTRAELFRSAIRVLRWMAQKKAEGCTIVAITPDERYIEPEFDFFVALSSGHRALDDKFRPVSIPTKDCGPDKDQASAREEVSYG